MTILSPHALSSTVHAPTSRIRGFVRPLAVILLLALLAGTTLLLVLFLSRPPATSPSLPAPVSVTQPATQERLSEGTLRVLRQLSSSVEIRFYALLDDNLGTAATRSFAERVSRLLGTFEEAGGERLQVTRLETRSSETEVAARTDGITPMPRAAKGTNFLGLALRCGDQKAVISTLAPEWEEALEFDLSRAIQQISGGLAIGQVILNPTPESFSARDELRQALPQLDSLSLEEARQQLQMAGLEEYKEAVAGFQTQLQEAQRKVARAQQEGPAETQAARQALQALQARQVDQLRTISQRMQDRIATLEHIKAGRL